MGTTALHIMYWLVRLTVMKLPIVKLNLPQRNLLGGRPGVVDENVQSSKAVTSGFHGSLGERRIGDIAGQSYGFASRGPKGLCYRFCGVQM
jgi:hypothetical protein